MKLLLTSLFIGSLVAADTVEKPITIAVIDTGFGFHGVGQGAKLCKYGHKDFTKIKKFNTDFNTIDPVPIDQLGHGTNVAGLIENYAKNANFCLVILKYSDPLDKDSGDTEQSDLAIKYANSINVDVINYSGGGFSFSPVERYWIRKFLNKGRTFVAAAGNHKTELNGIMKSKFYPAMDDPRIVVVGSRKGSPIENMYEHGGDLEGANWNVMEEMPKMRDKFEKRGYFIVSVNRTEKRPVTINDTEIEASYDISYFRVLIQQFNEVFVKSDTSNFGKLVTRWETGEEQTAYGITRSGTSQSSAIATGKIVNEMYQKNRLGAK